MAARQSPHSGSRERHVGTGRLERGWRASCSFSTWIVWPPGSAWPPVDAEGRYRLLPVRLCCPGPASASAGEMEDPGFVAKPDRIIPEDERSGNGQVSSTESLLPLHMRAAGVGTGRSTPGPGECPVKAECDPEATFKTSRRGSAPPSPSDQGGAEDSRDHRGRRVPAGAPSPSLSGAPRAQLTGAFSDSDSRFHGNRQRQPSKSQLSNTGLFQNLLSRDP